MTIDFIVWDLDGVMIHGQEGVINGVNHVLRMTGRPLMTPDHIQMLLTAPKVQVAFERICSVPPEVAATYADMYRDAYLKHYLFEASVQDGIIEVLETLHRENIVQAIATNKRHECAVKLCQYFGFTEYCSPVIGSDGKAETKKSDLIHECLAVMGCKDPKRAVMIGDLQGDLKSAKEVGVHFLGVNYGYGFHDVPGYANSPGEIPARLKEI